MSLSNQAPVVVKPGRDLRRASSAFDFLLPPASLGGAIGQPVLAGTVSSLPWIGDSNYTIDQGVGTTPRYVTFNYSDFCVTIPHNLGYVPIVLFNTFPDFRVSGGRTASVAVDDTTVNIYVNVGPQQASGTFLSVAPISYFVLRTRWI